MFTEYLPHARHDFSHQEDGNGGNTDKSLPFQSLHPSRSVRSEIIKHMNMYQLTQNPVEERKHGTGYKL
jgi:hypothetical protein